MKLRSRSALAKCGLILLQRAGGFLLLRLQHLDAGDGRRHPCLARLHGGDGLIVVGLRLLQRGPAVDLPCCQFLLAFQFEVGAGGTRPGGGELRLGLVDRGLLGDDLPAETVNGGLLDGDLVARGLDGEAIIAIIDAHDDIAGRDVGVVLHRDLGDIT